MERSTEASRASAHRRTAYALAAGATAACTAGPADAAIVYSGLQNLTINPGAYQILRLDGDNRDDLQLKNYNFAQGRYFGAFLIRVYGRFVGFQDNDNTKGPGMTPLTLGYASALGLGAVIDSGSINEYIPQAVMAYGAVNPNGQFETVNDKYLGFRFRIGPPEAPSLHFGWLRLDTNRATGLMTVKDWAYQSDPEVGILAGAGGRGDFNGDTLVNGNDLLLWQQQVAPPTGGAPTPDARLNDWRAAFGTGSSATPAAVAAPEPGTLGFLAAGAVGLALLRRRGAR
jgi:hypothetical protein